MPNEPRNKTYYVFSYGITPPRQFTLEALAAMRSCGVVFSSAIDEGTQKTFLKLAGGVKLVRCASPRTAERSVINALREHDTVGFLTFGNPLFYSWDGSRCFGAAKRAGARIRVLPGISTFDELVIKFKLKGYLKNGMRISDFSGRKLQPPDPDSDSFYYNARGFFSLAASRRRAILGAFKKLYPGKAPAFLAHCAGSECDDGDNIIRKTMDELPELLELAGFANTLFIPAVKSAKRRPGTWL